MKFSWQNNAKADEFDPNAFEREYLAQKSREHYLNYEERFMTQVHRIFSHEVRKIREDNNNLVRSINHLIDKVVELEERIEELSFYDDNANPKAA